MNNQEWWATKKEVPKQQEKYAGWLNSDNIVKRSIGVYFHFILGQFFLFLIAIGIGCFIWFLFMIYHTIIR